MTHSQIVIAIVIVLAAAAIGYFWLRRGQHVDMAQTDAKPLPTLSRQVLTEPKPALPPSPIPPSGIGDDLRKLKGVGPRLAARLGELGVTRFDQLAALSDRGIAELDAQLGSFAGRIRRDNWVDQAKLLAVGDVAGFEAKYGKLDSENRPS